MASDANSSLSSELVLRVLLKLISVIVEEFLMLRNNPVCDEKQLRMRVRVFRSIGVVIEMPLQVFFV